MAFPTHITAYKPISLCGKGAYGAVWLVTDVFGNFRALKIVSKSSIGSNWEKEFNGLKNYQAKVKIHPNLIQIFHIEDCSVFFYYVMECADNFGDDCNYTPSTLANWLNKWQNLEYDTILSIFDGLLDGIEFLHQKGLVHRDIKPDNIIFVNSVPKLSDIGLISTTTHTMSLAGTRSFIAPEILTGKRKKFLPADDLYALGKTLYCCFSGEEANEFPLVHPKIFKKPQNKILNKLAKKACAIDSFSRLKTIEEFRSVLQGNLGWKYEAKQILLKLTYILVFPIYCLWFSIKCFIRSRWLQVGFIFLVITWISMVIKQYWLLEMKMFPHEKGFHAEVFKRALKEWYVQIGSYDLYDFYYKSDILKKKYGDKYLVTKEEYQKAKHTYIPTPVNFELEIDDPTEYGSIQTKQQVAPPVNLSNTLRNEYLYDLVFDKLDASNLKVPNMSEWRNKILYLPAMKNGKIQYPLELPLRSEINISFNPKNFNGELKFILTSAEYIQEKGSEIPTIPLKRQLRFFINSDGKNLTFDDVVFRNQDNSEEDLMIFAIPKIKSIPIEDRYYNLKIISADVYRRVYLNGNLIWACNQAFFGGYFEMQYSNKNINPLLINHFSVYDTKLVQPDERGKSRLKLPQERPITKILSEEEKLKLSYKNYNTFLPKDISDAKIICTKNFYGLSNSNNNIINANSVSLGEGKSYLIYQNKFKSPGKFNFNIKMGNSQSCLTIHILEMFDNKIALQSYHTVIKGDDKDILPNEELQIQAEYIKTNIVFKIINQKNQLIGKRAFWLNNAKELKFIFDIYSKDKFELNLQDDIPIRQIIVPIAATPVAKKKEVVLAKAPVVTKIAPSKITTKKSSSKNSKISQAKTEENIISSETIERAKDDIAKVLNGRPKLKNYVSNYSDITGKEVMINKSYDHSTSGLVHEFTIPKYEIKGKMRILYLLSFIYREPLELFVKDEPINIEDLYR